MFDTLQFPYYIGVSVMETLPQQSAVEAKSLKVSTLI